MLACFSPKFHYRLMTGGTVLPVAIGADRAFRHVLPDISSKKFSSNSCIFVKFENVVYVGPVSPPIDPSGMSPPEVTFISSGFGSCIFKFIKYHFMAIPFR